MRIAIVADIHANLEALHQAQSLCSELQPDRRVVLGDIVGYGADPAACLETLSPWADLTVQGNHDAAAAGTCDLSWFNPVAAEAIRWTRSQLTTAQLDLLRQLPLEQIDEWAHWVHGSPLAPESWTYVTSPQEAQRQFPAAARQLCFVAHSHIPLICVREASGTVRGLRSAALSIKDDCSYIVNVGSVGQPRDNDPRVCVCLYDANRQQVTFHRRAYDVAAAQRKIRAAGLPRILAHRLAEGF